MHQSSKHSPVTQADCKLTTFEDGPLCVDVKFTSQEQLMELIQALTLLSESTDFDHIHLQDAQIRQKTSLASTEIVFHQVGSCFDSTRDELISHAEKRLGKGL